jgi:hypothetical protein
MRIAVESYGLTDDGEISTVPPLPGAMAQHDRPRARREGIVVRQEEASRGRFNSEDTKELGRNALCLNALRRTRAR